MTEQEDRSFSPAGDETDFLFRLPKIVEELKTDPRTRKVGEWLLKEEPGVQVRQPCLAAVSGGRDSLVMLLILHALEFRVTAAHVNYGLRPSALDDECFVRRVCQRLGIPVRVRRFLTVQKVCVEKGWSVEMACRHLRYTWLEEERRRGGFHFIATAHHQRDNLETILLNLVHGRSLEAIAGIPPRREHIIRPLLVLTHQEIEEIAREYRLYWREDPMNRDLRFERNRIRHQVLPVLYGINPSVEEAGWRFSWMCRDVVWLARYAFERRLKKKLLIEREGEFWIPFRKVRNLPAWRTLFFWLLEPFGFSRAQIMQMVREMEGQPGAEYYSPTFRLIRDRSHWILTPRDRLEEVGTIFVIDRDRDVVETPEGTLKVEILPAEDVLIEPNPNRAYLNYNRVKFPMILRRWRPGDYFYPFGMRKKKKLKKFFTDLRLSRPDKEKIWILETDRRIAWVVGFRQDERFRVHKKTRKVVVLTWVPRPHYPRPPGNHISSSERSSSQTPSS